MKKTMSSVLAWKTGACLSFTAAVILYSVIAWACGQRAVELRILLSLLLVCAAGSAIQLLCFTEHIIRKMRYTRRTLLFLALFFPLLSGTAWLFRWFPTEYAESWLVFGGSFAATFMVVTIGFEIYYRAAGKRYDGLLGQYRREKESQEN